MNGLYVIQCGPHGRSAVLPMTIDHEEGLLVFELLNGRKITIILRHMRCYSLNEKFTPFKNKKYIFSGTMDHIYLPWVVPFPSTSASQLQWCLRLSSSSLTSL